MRGIHSSTCSQRNRDDSFLHHGMRLNAGYSTRILMLGRTLAGTGTAIKTADIALMEDDLRKLPLFIALSRQTGRVLMQNITLSIGLKVAFSSLPCSGKRRCGWRFSPT